MPQTEDVYRQYLADLLAGRRTPCADTVRALLDEGVGIRDIYVSLFQRSLYDVGRLWETGRISVATEHLATAITEALMPLVYPAMFAAERAGRSGVISCVADEQHQIGAKMVADVLELHGWDGYFLGANTPLADLLDLIEQKQPDLVGLSLSVYFNMPKLTAAIAAVRDRFPDTPVLVGGQAFAWGSVDDLGDFGHIEHIPSLADLEARLEAQR